MKRAAIFINGKRLRKERVLKELKKTDTIICADGGVKHVLAFGLMPHSVIGDQDSISKKLKQQLSAEKIVWITHPPEKDFTDSELAIEYSLEKGFKEIIVFGVSGTRLDHVLSNILYLTYHTKTLNVTIIEDFQTLTILKKGSVKIVGEKNQQVSLIPLDSDVTGITTKGLKWELSKAHLEFGKTIGVSNELVGTSATIEVKKGPLLVIHSLKNL